MKKYCMYIVDSSDEDFDKSTAGYFEVKESAFDYAESDSLETILRVLIDGINNEGFSDQNWYFITNEENGIILMS